MSKVNSRDYWDMRFSGDWEEKGGGEQTAFFGRLALEMLPSWFRKRVQSAEMTFCDWGCGTGEATAILADELGVNVAGVDFSEVAIESARKFHPKHAFYAEDWLSSQKSGSRKFDVVFSSNTLEHFHEPWDVFRELTLHARSYVVLLLPFMEAEHVRHPEHFYSFSPESFLLSRQGWKLVHASVIDTSNLDADMWPGQQILVIYAAEKEAEASKIALGEMTMSFTREGASKAETELPVQGNALYRMDRKVARAERRVQASLVLFGKHMNSIHSSMLARCDDLARMQHDSHKVIDEAVLSVGNAVSASHEELFKKLDAHRDLGRSEKFQHFEMIDNTLAALVVRINKIEGDHQHRLHELEDRITKRIEKFSSSIDGLADIQRGSHEVIDKAVISVGNAVSASHEELFKKLDAHWGRKRSKKSHRIETIDSTLASIVSRIDQMEKNDQIRLREDAREIGALRQRNHQLASAMETYNLVVGSRSWRWTRPLRQFGALLRGKRPSIEHVPIQIPRDFPLQVVADENHDGAALVPSADARFKMPDVPLASVERELPDVFVWAVIDWHFRIQRPQHLARAMAEAGHRVFYISNNFVDSAIPGFSVEPLGTDDRLFQVNLHLNGAPPIYFDPPTAEQGNQLRQGLSALVNWAGTRKSISIVQHPYWTKLVRMVPNARMVYDCMDHHAGFEASDPKVLEAENRLVDDADLVIVTSDFLMEEVGSKARNTVMVRNAGEFTFFNTRPAEVFRDEKGRQVIGYFGAIAEWFNVDLVREVARANPDALVLLVGSDTAGAAQKLASEENIIFTGEVPYASLPFYLYGFDVALLPFRIIPLTLATNPVKIYEYLASGVPVVAVDLPEMSQFGDLVRIGKGNDSFVKHVTSALAESMESSIRQQRINFARQQTWGHRAGTLDKALESIAEPRVSVIVLTYNNWAFTDACLFSIEHYSDYPNLEIIVVDNASTDCSRGRLQEWADESSPAGHVRRLILNDSNLGFSAGNNVGLAAATGDYLVILNNDTYVTPGWVRSLMAHVRTDNHAGLVGPVTNNIGNEAKIEINYSSMEEMITHASEYTRRHAGHAFQIRTLAFFCVMMPRSTYERVGPMDEDFGVGFFEDDDYCRRVEVAGLSNLCADDVFVHHHLSASFDELKKELKQKLFEKNKEIYENKWGAWQPHMYRQPAVGAQSR